MGHDRILTKENSILLVIDYQEKLLAAFNEPDPFIDCSIKLIKFAQILKLPVVWTEQYPKGLGRTIEKVRVELRGMTPVEKTSFSCFGEPHFISHLSEFQRKQLIVCGIETHICIEQTVLDALDAGYQAHVIIDACGSRKKSDHKTGLRKMGSAGAIMSSFEMALYEILGRSDSPEFREVLKLVK
jgi:nicotinamidase-related amidase